MTAAVLLLLLALQHEESLQRWVLELGHDDPDVRVRAEASLTHAGMAAHGILTRHAKDADPERRGRIRRILGVLQLAEETKFLTGAAVEDRARALEALGPDPFGMLMETPDSRYVPALTDVILFELDPERRARAVEALIAIGTPRIYPALLWSLRYPPDRGDRAAAWLALHGDLTLVDELERMGREKTMSALVVLRAVQMRHAGKGRDIPVEWAPIGAEPVLYAAAEGRSIAQRARGLRAIATGLSSDIRGLRILRSALEGREEELRFRAAEAFARISWGEAVEALARRLAAEGETPRVRRMCAAGLARNGSASATRALKEALNSESVEIRRAASDALNGLILKD